MKTILTTTGENENNLKELLDKIDNIKPDVDLYSVLVDEQIHLIEV